MKSRRMNVNLSVGEMLYEEIVYPAKEDKRLGKLVVSLLEGYRTNEYVRALIDGDLDAQTEEMNSELGDILKDMTNTLNESDFHVKAAESTVSDGAQAFTGDGPSTVYEGTDSATPDRLDRLEDVVETLSGTVNSFISAVASGNVNFSNPQKQEAPEPTTAPEEPKVSEPEPERVSPAEVEDEIEEGLSAEPVEVDSSDFFDDYESSDMDDDDFEEETAPPAATDLLARLTKNVNKGGL